MKEDVKNKWIAELRSGKHRQAKGVMRDDDGAMCCLGVLQCVVLEIPLDHDGTTVLGYDAQVAAGIGHTNGSYRLDNATEDQRMFNCLAEDNDGGQTFEQIADTIEKHWEHL